MPRLAVLAAAVCFGTTGTAQALGPSLEPAAVGAGRIVVGGVLLVLVAAVVAGRLVAPARGERGVVLVAGACVAVYQLTFFAAVADTGVAVGTVVAIGSAPAFAGVLGRVVNGEPLDRGWAAATALACGGVVLLVLAGSGGAAEVSAPGVALALLAGAGYAAYAVSSKRLLDGGREPEWTMAAVFGTGAVLVVPVLAVVPAGGLLTLDGAALIVYLGAIPHGARLHPLRPRPAPDRHRRDRHADACRAADGGRARRSGARRAARDSGGRRSRPRAGRRRDARPAPGAGAGPGRDSGKGGRVTKARAKPVPAATPVEAAA